MLDVPTSTPTRPGVVGEGMLTSMTEIDYRHNGSRDLRCCPRRSQHVGRIRASRNCDLGPGRAARSGSAARPRPGQPTRGPLSARGHRSAARPSAAGPRGRARDSCRTTDIPLSARRRDALSASAGPGRGDRTGHGRHGAPRATAPRLDPLTVPAGRRSMRPSHPTTERGRTR
ncbi:Uncharacterised protein [Mycobacteroides abscessus]|nr:Uncharacterised protein [Mycobacteroides abscessus]